MHNLNSTARDLHSEFQANGFVSLPGFLDPDELLEWNAQKRRLIEDLVPSLAPNLVYYEERDRPETLKQVQMLQEHDSFFRQMLLGSKFEQLAEVLLGECVIAKNMQYFNKPPSMGQPTPPHQDGFYFMLEPNHAITMWLALEDVGIDQGCVSYVRGSHKLGMRAHSRSDVLGFSQHIPDFGTTHDQQNQVLCTCKAGHLIAHHSLTIHWAGANVSPNRSREALGFIYYAKSAQEDRLAHAEYQGRLAAQLANQEKI